MSCKKCKYNHHWSTDDEYKSFICSECKGVTKIAEDVENVGDLLILNITLFPCPIIH